MVEDSNIGYAMVSAHTTTPYVPKKERKIRKALAKAAAREPRKPRVSKPVMVFFKSPGAEAWAESPSITSHTTSASASKVIRDGGVDGYEYLVVRVLLRKRLKRTQLFKNTLE